MSEEVQRQLDRILASQALAGSDQLKRFMRLTVERTINGQSDLLKEYNLGLEVFQRPPDYDPKVDPIVRVQARRLRAKLDEYYAGEGAQDSLVICIPKGAYVPKFSHRSAAVAPAKSRRTIWIAAGCAAILATVVLAVYVFRKSPPSSADVNRSIAVLPLKSYINDDGRSRLPDQVTEVLTTELAKSKQLRVLSRTTASTYRDRAVALPEIARSMGVRWIVEGGVGTEGTRMYVKLRAVDSLTDRKVWADGYDCEISRLVEANAKAAAKIEAAIAARLAEK